MLLDSVLHSTEKICSMMTFHLFLSIQLSPKSTKVKALLWGEWNSNWREQAVLDTCLSETNAYSQTSRKGTPEVPGLTISLLNITCSSFQTALLHVNQVAWPHDIQNWCKRHYCFELLLFPIISRCLLTPCGACDALAAPARTICWPIYIHQGPVVLKSWAFGSWPCYQHSVAHLPRLVLQWCGKAFVKSVATLPKGRSHGNYMSCLADRDPWLPLCC